MSSRVFGVLIAAVLVLGALAVPAAAVEDDDEHFAPPKPSIDEIGSGSEASQQFRPEPVEPPELFDAILLPLVGVSVLLLFLVGGLYLIWQPRFAKESEQQGRR